jgi:transposase
MTQRREFSAEYKREVVAMLDAPGVTVNQIATELGIGAGMLGRWRRELRQETERAFPGQGRPRDEEVVHLKRELARVTKERSHPRPITHSRHDFNFPGSSHFQHQNSQMQPQKL